MTTSQANVLDEDILITTLADCTSCRQLFLTEVDEDEGTCDTARNTNNPGFTYNYDNDNESYYPYNITSPLLESRTQLPRRHQQRNITGTLISLEQYVYDTPPRIINNKHSSLRTPSTYSTSSYGYEKNHKAYKHLSDCSFSDIRTSTTVSSSTTGIPASSSTSSFSDTKYNFTETADHEKQQFVAIICKTPLIGSLSILNLLTKGSTSSTFNMSSPTTSTTTPTTTAIADQQMEKIPSTGINPESDLSKDINNTKQTDPTTTISTLVSKLQFPVLSYKDGTYNKASFGLNTFNHVLCTLDGRDKFTKLLQYLCRLLVWYLPSSSSSSSENQHMSIYKSKILSFLKKFFIAERFSHLQKSLSSSRKVYRIGRSLIEIQKILSLGLHQWVKTYIQNTCCTSSIVSPQRSDDTKLIIKEQKEPLWYIGGNTVKSLGLLFFWLADNITFLIQSGFYDNYSDGRTLETTRLNSENRLKYSAITTNIANRSYFIGAIAGFVTNYLSYMNYTKTTLRDTLLKEELFNNTDSVISCVNTDEDAFATRTALLQKVKEKHFTLCMALIKSICDVLVFSNNPGVDLWRTYTKKLLREQRPMPEILHCLCGILSAGIVLYNNYPSISDME